MVDWIKRYKVCVLIRNNLQGTLYFRECFPGLRELVYAGVKISLCLDFVAVATANLAQRVLRLELSRSRPSSASWSVREGAQ